MAVRNGDDPLGRLFGQATPDAPAHAGGEPAVDSGHDNGQVARISTPDPLAEPFSEPVAAHDNGQAAPPSTPEPDPPARPSIEPDEDNHNGQVTRTEPEPARRARRLTRGVVRRIDPWSVLKLSVVFYVTVYCILLVAAVLLWTAATTTGLRGNVESFIADLIASGQFHFVAGELLRAGVVGGAILVVLGTGANVMLAVLYNLISDMVGGLSVVVEERCVAGTPSRESEPDTDPEPARLLIPETDIRPRPSRRVEPSGL